MTINFLKRYVAKKLYCIANKFSQWMEKIVKAEKL